MTRREQLVQRHGLLGGLSGVYHHLPTSNQLQCRVDRIGCHESLLALVP